MRALALIAFELMTDQLQVRCATPCANQPTALISPPITSLEHTRQHEIRKLRNSVKPSEQNMKLSLQECTEVAGINGASYNCDFDKLNLDWKITFSLLKHSEWVLRTLRSLAQYTCTCSRYIHLTLSPQIVTWLVRYKTVSPFTFK